MYVLGKVLCSLTPTVSPVWAFEYTPVVLNETLLLEAELLFEQDVERRRKVVPCLEPELKYLLYR